MTMYRVAVRHLDDNSEFTISYVESVGWEYQIPEVFGFGTEKPLEFKILSVVQDVRDAVAVSVGEQNCWVEIYTGNDTWVKLVEVKP